MARARTMAGGGHAARGAKVITTPNAMAAASGMGWNSGAAPYRRQYDEPWFPQGGLAREARDSYYRTLWSYYDNSAFEDLVRWGIYKGQYKLYRQMRSIYNPTRRLVDFYAGAVYPGVLTTDAEKLPDGVPCAIPLAADTDPRIVAAIGQLWRWSNWQAQKSVYVRYGAVTGNVLVEAIDDVDEGRVTLNIVWPGLVPYLDLSPEGHVLGYVLQYVTMGDDGYPFIYRKEVDSQVYRTYRNGELWDFGEGGEWNNPYGFTPAVWAKHRHNGTNYGEPAMYGTLGKVDELNSIASHLHDHIHKAIGAPIAIFSEGGITNLTGANKQTKRGPEFEGGDAISSDRESLLMLHAPKGGTVASLAGQLSMKDAGGLLDRLMSEIEADNPELTMYRQLRAMSQVTGPAADKLMGDVGGRLAESSANYDHASNRLFAMALAIGGWRVGNGDWPQSKASDLFRPFDLASLDDGSLEYDIALRPLVPLTRLEELELERRKVALLIDQRAASIDLTTIATDLQKAAETSVVRSVIPRGSNG